MSTSPAQVLPKKPWYQYLTKEDRKAFFAAWIGVLLDGYDFVLISFALPAIKEAFNLTLVESASLISAAFISRWIGGLVLGAIGDRYGRKPAMILSIFMFAFGVIAAAQVDKYFVTWVDSVHPGWGWRALFLTGIVPILVAIYMRRTLPEAADWSEAKEKGHVEKNDMLAVLFGGERKILNYIVVVVAFVGLLLIFTQQVGGIIAVSLVGVVCAIVFIYLIIQFDSNRWIIGIAIMLTIFASFMYTWPIQGLLPTYLHGVGMDQKVVANVVSFAGLGNAVGYVIAGFAGDRFGMRRWYAISLLLSQVIVFPLFTQDGKYVALVAGLLFFQQMFGQGVSGLLPKWVSSYFPVDKRAAGLGFCYNVGALGGAVGPVLGAAIADQLGLGMALAILSFGFAAIVMVSIGANIPRLLQRMVGPAYVRPEDGNDEIIAEG